MVFGELLLEKEGGSLGQQGFFASGFGRRRRSSRGRGRRLLCVNRVDVIRERYKDPRRLELEPVGRTRRLVVLQVDRTAGRRRRQVDVVLGQQVLVLRHPVAEHVGVVRWNDSYLCKLGKKKKSVIWINPRSNLEDSPKSLSSHVCFASSRALYTSRLGSVPENT